MCSSILRRRLIALGTLDPHLRTLVLLYLAVKVGLVAVALLGHALVPFNWAHYQVNLVLDVQHLPDIFRAFNTWDTQHYLLLSQRGYGVNPMSNAFYPLYPYLIWALTPFFFGKGLIAAYCIANVLSLLVPVYMYKLCCLFHTKDQAFRATVLLLSFPTAFFLSVAYTEALYLSLCLMAFYYLFKEDVPKASLFCFLLPLTRAQALLFVVPIGVRFLHALSSGNEHPRVRAVRAARTFLPPAVATLVGMAAYFLFCRWQLGGFLEGLNAQSLYVAHNSLGNLLSPYQWFLDNFVNIDLQLHGFANSMMDRAAFLLCLPLLPGVYRTQPGALFAYAAVTLLVPALAGNLMSYTRMLFVVFPMYMYVGVRFPRSAFLAVPMFALQVLFYLMHTGGYWVA
jgi:hypothetical protein